MVINRSQPAGFFSDFTWILTGMSEVLETGCIPYVPTKADETVLGQDVNWEWSWNDYFLQPIQDLEPFLGGIGHLNPSVHPVSQSKKTQLSNLLYVFNSQSGFQPHVRDLLQQISMQMVPKRTLGVHFRAGDMRWAPLHPTPPSETFMLDLIGSELSDGGFESIYVASTNREFIRKTTTRFPSYEVRSSLDTASEISRATGSNYTKLPVLADAFLLGRCERLLHSASNVAFASKLLSTSALRSSGEIDMGVNHSWLSYSVACGTLFWPVFSHFRGQKAKQVNSSRESWGI
jgi:hypothetical protein